LRFNSPGRCLIASSLVGGLLGLAPAAHADVLINAPRQKVCLHRAIKLGVWYQEQSGGPRWFRVRVRSPRGKTVFFTRGKASPDRWHYWRYWTERRGTYRVNYRVPGARYHKRVRVIKC
jgi:hypothetical protein